LYGFDSHASALVCGESAWGGSIDFRHGERDCRVTRMSIPHADGDLSLTGWNDETAARELLPALLGGVSREMFERVWAIGLSELQELATLQDEEIADCVYGVSLGPDGRQLLAAIRSAGETRREFFNADNRSGQLFELLELEDGLSNEIRSLAGKKEEFNEFLKDQVRLDVDIRQLQQRHSGMKSQLRGHRFLERVWGPWKQARQYREEFESLPDVRDFPENGLRQLTTLEAEVESEKRCRDLLRKEAAGIRQSLAALPQQTRFLQHAPALRFLLCEGNEIETRSAEAAECGQTIPRLQHEFQTRLESLGDGWPQERLESIDCTPSAQFRLFNAGRKFQSAVIRRGRFRRLSKKLSRSCRKNQSQLARRTDSSEGKPLAESLELARKRLESLDKVDRLKQREHELNRRAQQLRSCLQASGDKTQSVMPRWFFRVLIVFAVMGGLVAVAGIITGFSSNTLAGAVLAFSGLTGVGIAWGLQLQLSSQRKNAAGRSQDELREIESRLNDMKVVLIQVEAKREQAFGTQSVDQILKAIDGLHREYCTDSATSDDALSRSNEVKTALDTRIEGFSVDNRRHAFLKGAADLDLKGEVNVVRCASVKLAEARDTRISEKLAVLQSASAFVDKLEDEKTVDCPACGQTISVEAFKEHVKAEHKRLQEINHIFNTKKAAIGTVCDT
ncbi:MAG: hypothetical protein IID45_16030, partial [Planctomycetes bacterium]|nr:hypothetical protein [Planctomycetota bacterium]